MKTAVDYLFERLSSLYLFKDAILAKNELEKAKELEKQQIVEAFNGGYNTPHGEKCAQSGEDYYIETYK